MLGETGRHEFIDYIARNPEAGALIPDTGGLRKVRWSRDGMGKRGGVRVIYYYHGDEVPLFLFTVYGKGAKENLGVGEKAAFRAALVKLKEELRSQLRGRGIPHGKGSRRPTEHRR